MDKEQFKLWVEPQLKDRLTRLAQKCGYSSAQQFALEALEEYAELLADLLIEVRDQAELLRQRQRAQLLGKTSQESPARRK